MSYKNFQNDSLTKFFRTIAKGDPDFSLLNGFTCNSYTVDFDSGTPIARNIMLGNAGTIDVDYFNNNTGQLLVEFKHFFPKSFDAGFLPNRDTINFGKGSELIRESLFTENATKDTAKCILDDIKYLHKKFRAFNNDSYRVASTSRSGDNKKFNTYALKQVLSSYLSGEEPDIQYLNYKFYASTSHMAFFRWATSNQTLVYPEHIRFDYSWEPIADYIRPGTETVFPGNSVTLIITTDGKIKFQNQKAGVSLEGLSTIRDYVGKPGKDFMVHNDINLILDYLQSN